MTVREFIEKLQAFEPDAVILAEYDGGYSDPGLWREDLTLFKGKTRTEPFWGDAGTYAPAGYEVLKGPQNVVVVSFARASDEEDEGVREETAS